MVSNSTTRFSSRVENYVKYRPDYPPDTLRVIGEHCGLTPDTVVADIGAGTGIFTRRLLENGNRVFGVEPNANMRAAAHVFLSLYPRFVGVDGTAEQTTLSSRSVGLIAAAQAFHWFNRERTRPEFVRILEPGGWLVLLWNDRRLNTTPFLSAYEQLLQQFGTDYLTVRHHDLDLTQVRLFVGSDAVSLTVLENRQLVDYDGLRGRLLSSSYAPEAEHPAHEPMLRRLQEIFTQFQSGGTVSLDYDTQIYCAQLDP